MRATCYGFVVAVLLACGCAGREITTADAGKLDMQPDEVPQGNSFPGVSTFDVAESGNNVHVLIGMPIREGGKDIALSHIRTDDGGASWLETVPIPTAHAPPTKLHRGDDPQIAVSGDRVLALWTARGDGPFGSGPLATALSDDGGHTWRAGPSPAAQPLPPGSAPPRASATPASSHKHAGTTATGAGYRFPAAAAGPEGFHVVWIHAVGDERSLRHAMLPFGATEWSPATIVDPHICACCWNELKVAPDGTLMVLYRDQQPSDMVLARSRDGGRTWHSAGRAGEFDWRFDGCPHVGGGIAILSDPTPAVLATAWTGKASGTGAYVVQRDCSGEWSAPTPLSTEGAAGRNTDVAATGQAAAVVWDQLGGDGQVIYAAMSTNGGSGWSSPRQVSRPGQNAGYPRVVPVGNRFLALWTVYGPDGTVSLQTQVLR
jgi:hypothetical protein